MYRQVILCLLLISGYANAHEWTPTYPKLEYSFIPGVLKVSMELFNNRTDVNHYEISVFDDNWDPVKFAISDRIISLTHLRRKSVDVYIREQDRSRVTYVCSKSKIISNDERATVVTSRICSKVKKG